MSKVDWSKAPEGATHCDIDGPEFYRPADNHKGGEYFDPDTGRWVVLVDDFKYLTPHCEARPTEWIGEGLPPVGTICEFQLSDRWSECEILAHYNGKIVAVAKETGAVGYIGLHELRPIRTPEQIAADVMREIIRATRIPNEYVEEVTHALIKAGYRLQEKPE